MWVLCSFGGRVCWLEMMSMLLWISVLILFGLMLGSVIRMRSLCLVFSMLIGGF